ncbi:MAG TPA: GTPase Era [Alphaproteobacteria bacterium]|nr:GTPase Era [Alphaproteobacteria bacterium]
MSDTPKETPRCGYVALIGAPNAGKSTLLNALVGAKVAIVSPKVQTTRTRVLGITVEGASQLVFVDTPGIFAPKRRLERAMVAAAWEGADDADLVVLLVDASARLKPETLAIADRLKEYRRPALLALNKIDAVKPPVLLDLAERLNRAGSFAETMMISALTGDGVADLRRTLAARVPDGPWLFPEDQLSDMPERLLAAEITREKLFLRLQQELPYSLTVETESWEDLPDGSTRISQTVYVQPESQKPIVLGRGGQMIKSIGTSARRELEAILERRVHLSLYVKVRERWIDDPERYRDWGLDYNA